MTFTVQEGQHYSVQVTVTNSSMRGTMPASAHLSIFISAASANHQFIDAQEIGPYFFGKGGSYTWEVPMYIDPLAADDASGVLGVSVLDPDGNMLANSSATLNIEFDIEYGAGIDIGI